MLHVLGGTSQSAGENTAQLLEVEKGPLCTKAPVAVHSVYSVKWQQNVCKLKKNVCVCIYNIQIYIE